MKYHEYLLCVVTCIRTDGWTHVMRVVVAIISANLPRKAYGMRAPNFHCLAMRSESLMKYPRTKHHDSLIYLSFTGELPLIKLLSPVQIPTPVGRLFISLIYGMFRHLSLHNCSGHLFGIIHHLPAPASTVSIRCLMWLMRAATVQL